MVFWWLVLVLGSFLPTRLGPPPGRWGQAVSWRLCRLETARALWVLCRLMGGCLVGEPIFLLWGSGMFLPYSWFFACPAGAKTTFSFAAQKKKRFWTPKKKRQTGGNDYGLRYNRAKPQSCFGIPWVKSFGLSFCFRRHGVERPVVPLAPLPLSGWNTVSCSLVFTPPGGWFSEGVG